MIRIDCSYYCDNQSAFRNGMHDCIDHLPISHNLYRKGFPKARINRTLWWFGWHFQNLFGLGYVKDLVTLRKERLEKLRAEIHKRLAAKRAERELKKVIGMQ